MADSVFAEGFKHFFPNEKEAPQGVKDWVISTLGPQAVGKTVLISGLYTQYHLGTQIGKSIGIEAVDHKLHNMLKDISDGLKSRPIRVPGTTKIVQNARLKFSICLNGPTYQKIVSLQDHAGEHLDFNNENHEVTLEGLRRSDSFMVFIDSQALLDDDFQGMVERIKFNLISSLIRDISYELHEGDIIPVSVAFSKADLVMGQEQMLIERGIRLFRELSMELPQCVFCFSPVSVLRRARSYDDDGRFLFSLKNAEIPFLFCLASVVIRNSLILESEANRLREDRREVAAQDFSDLGFFKRIGAIIVRASEIKRLTWKSERYVTLSTYDSNLAKSALKIVNAHENVSYMQRGEIYTDVNEMLDNISR